MDSLESASMANGGFLRRDNSAIDSGNVQLFYRVANRGISLVCGAHSPWIPPSSPALAGAGGVGQNFRIELTFLKPVGLDGSLSLKTNVTLTPGQ
jgi:hypothetical protein